MEIRFMLKLLHTVEQFRRRERWTRQQLLAYQARQLSLLREHAYAHSPFYKHFHAGLTDQPLSALPVLTKAMLMEHFDELVTDPALHLQDVRAFAAQDQPGQRYHNRYWVTATSGSSGQPGFFLFDEAEWLQIMASFARGQTWSGATLNLAHRERMATVASISPWHTSSQVAATAQSWWRPSLRLAASQPLPQIVQQLNDWRPDTLIAYASMAGILAEEQLAGRLRIHPRLVYTSSEVLTRQTRERVKDAWGDEPFNQYGATETADVAAEHHVCRQMHFFEDLVIAEVVDERYRPVPPGEYGAKVLITTLFSRTQPLIRYELNDSVRVSAEPHDCGLPFAVLDNLQGRVEDVLELPAVAGGRIVVRPLVFNRVMDIAAIGGWQISQQADDGLVVSLAGTPDDQAAAALPQQLAQSLARAGSRVPYVRVQRVAAIPKSASGKAPLIKAYHAPSEEPI